MKVSEAIKKLQQLRIEHGDVEVFYDCGHCGKSTAPTTVVAVAKLIDAVGVK